MPVKFLLICSIVLISACSGENKGIRIKGSDTEVNLAVQLAESFYHVNPDIFISVSGGGSGLGIASLMNGTADIANSSRQINNKEVELFGIKGMQIDSFVFAEDAIAFVVAEDLPVDSISIADLAGIFSGGYTTWQQLAGKNIPINIYGRQSNSGTHDFVKKRLGINFTPYAKQMNGNAQILEAIKADHSGIGYVGAGYVAHGGSKGIKVLPVYRNKQEAAVSPLDSVMISEGKYFFQRPLYQYFKASVYRKIKPFLDFEKSEAGRRIIQSSGYYPINAVHEH